MARQGSLLQQDWQDTREGKEFTSGILLKNRRRMFGLIDAPSIPVSLKTQEVSYKIFLLGKSGVGKTSIVSKLVGRGVPVTHAETPGIQMSIVYWPAKLIQTQQIVMFKLVFWDAGEQSLKKFDHILPACREDADAVLFVFNLANKATWTDLPLLITRSEVNDAVLKIAVGSRADQKESIDIPRKGIRDFEKVWKIPVLKIANVDGPSLPDGKHLDGRASIKEISPFLNRLVELLWAHDQMSTGFPGVSRPMQTRPIIEDVPIANEKNQSVRKTSSNSADDNADRRSISSRHSNSDKLTITYC